MNNSGTDTDAEDIFQDAMVIVYEKIYNGTLRLTCHFNTYLFSICKHLWLQQIYVKKNIVVEDIEKNELPDVHADINKNYHEYIKDSLFHKYFLELNELCQKVLQLFFNKTSAKDVAKIMGYKSADYARRRKMKCKNTLKKMIMQDENYSILFNTN